jgi:Trk-type K+ transport system membrane component
MTTMTLPRWLLGLDVPQPADETRPVRCTESVVPLIAGLSFVAGLIHVGASLAHFSALPFYATAFAVVAALQVGWAAWLSRRPSRSALISGLVGNIAIVALWATSLAVAVRTPAQPLVHTHTVYLCFLSVIQGGAGGVSVVVALTAILPELVIALAAALLLAQARSLLAQRAIPKLAPVLLAVMFLSVLYGVGGHGG